VINTTSLPENFKIFSSFSSAVPPIKKFSVSEDTLL